MTIGQLCRTKRLTLLTCYGKESLVRIQANTARRRAAVEQAAIRAGGYVKRWNGDWLDAVVLSSRLVPSPTQTRSN